MLDKPSFVLLDSDETPTEKTEAKEIKEEVITMDFNLVSDGSFIKGTESNGFKNVGGKPKRGKNSLIPKAENDKLRSKDPGAKSKLAKLKDMLLEKNVAEKLVNRMIAVAMDDEHKDSFLALKFLNERLLPQSTFEKAKERGSIQVNIVNASVEKPIPVDSVPNNAPSDNQDISDIDYNDLS